MNLTPSQLKAAAELSRRQNDGLAMFRAMPTQEDFFHSNASEIGLWGGNRSGKSTSAAVKFAAVARDKPVYDSHGNAIEQRLPWQKDRPLLMWIVGLQLNHLGQTIYRLLFRPGLYKIIRDERTRRWRAFDPVADAHRKSEAKPSFPLIPQSEFDGEPSWHIKKEKQFSLIRLKNGTEIYGFASTADVKQGDPVDYIWIDERIAIPSHYSEWQARLSDLKGRIVWSSMPRADNGAMLRLNARAEKQAEEQENGERQTVDAEVFRLRFSDNSTIDPEEKRKRLESWTEDERKQRDEGLFLTDTIKIYPSFDKKLHAAIYDDPALDDDISRILRERNGEPPVDWTREMILDPGSAKPAILFGAVPPPTLWKGGEPYFVAYDEIYIPRMTANDLAPLVRNRVHDYSFNRFIIDGKAAAQTPMGFSLTVGSNYSKVFAAHGIQCEQTGSAFIPGDPNFQARSQVIERWLRFRPCGTPQLRIVTKRCPNLVWQLENNLKATTKGTEGVTIVLEKPASGQRDDVRDTLEYWASRNPTYVQPKPQMELVGGPGLKALENIRRMFPQDDPDDGVVRFGPGKKVTAA